MPEIAKGKWSYITWSCKQAASKESISITTEKVFMFMVIKINLCPQISENAE